MNIHSTSDVSIEELKINAEALPHEWEVAVDEHQMFFRSLDVPSWVSLIAKVPWWLRFLAAAASIYVTGIINEAGKDTWKNRSKIVSAVRKAPTAITNLAEFIMRARASVSPKTYFELAIPFPDDFNTIRLKLNDKCIKEVEFSIALFVYYLPELQNLWSAEGLIENPPAAGLQLELNDDLSMTVEWQDHSTLTKQKRTLRVR